MSVAGGFGFDMILVRPGLQFVDQLDCRSVFHERVLMIAAAAGQAGAKTALFVVPKPARELYMDQLRHMGFTAIDV